MNQPLGFPDITLYTGFVHNTWKGRNWVKNWYSLFRVRMHNYRKFFPKKCKQKFLNFHFVFSGKNFLKTNQILSLQQYLLIYWSICKVTKVTWTLFQEKPCQWLKTQALMHLSRPSRLHCQIAPHKIFEYLCNKSSLVQSILPQLPEDNIM